MLGLVVVLIFFMFRNGKKRQAAQQEMQNNMRPGVEVMLQGGIFGTVLSIDDEENRVTLQSGTSSMVVHRNAIVQIVTPVDAPAFEGADADLAPDDDPAFGERVAEELAAPADSTDSPNPTVECQQIPIQQILTERVTKRPRRRSRLP
ncbi:preprotein translocase subunit YajC [Leucobacter insecticola]|uniref:Preprotein translocase subunit YajC n=2 Tax=Leucobacter insecticola TaxID=2714934 RepID=A0A6G8FM45_9MICO|nr:preprotein translocase subunit YajC [Leucobacter insecticola]